MNDEVKEILIDLVDYWNAMGSENDPGFEVFANVVQRASKALERYSKRTTPNLDPFNSYDEFPDFIIKMEDEW